MDAIRRLETRIEEWLNPLPHLPTEWRRWLAESAWAIALIGVILSVLSIFAIVGSIFRVLTIPGPDPEVYGMYAYGVYPGYTGWWIFIQVVSIIFLLADTFVLSFAIKPLRLKSKGGWELLLLALVIAVISAIVGAIVTIGTIGFLPNLISAIIGVSLGGYLLFDMRTYFSR